MSSNDYKISFQTAFCLVEGFMSAFSLCCEKIRPAGSVRRRRAFGVGDLEFIAIPKMSKVQPVQQNLFNSVPAEPFSLLDREVVSQADDALWLRWREPRKNGAKFKALEIKLASGRWFPVDLFITTAEQWGYIMAIRTGPAELSKKLVTTFEKGGTLPAGYCYKDGYLHDRDQIIPTPKEKFVFNLAGYEMLPPEERDAWQVKLKKIREEVMPIE